MTDVFAPDPDETVDETLIPKLEDLKGEGKKYKDDDAVAKAIFEKDRFIARLIQEKKEVTEALQERSNEEAFLTRMEQLARPQPTPQEDTKPHEQVREAAVDPAKIEELVEKKLSEASKKSRADANLAAVTKALQDTYGTNYKSRVATQAQQLGVGTQWLTDLAAENPEAFYRVLGMNQMKPLDAFSPPPVSSVNTARQPSGTKNFAYYQEVRKKIGDSAYYSDTALQREIWEQAKALGGDPEEKTGFYKR
jgi:hypothetical protein